MTDPIAELNKRFGKKSIMVELIGNDYSYEKTISIIKERNKRYKIEFLAAKIKPLEKYPTQIEIAEFLYNLRPYLMALFLSKEEEEVISKLKVLRLKEETLRWFLSINELKKEIDRLVRIPELEMNPVFILENCIFYTETNILKSVEIDLGFIETYNKIPETSKSFIILNKSLKQRKYNQKKGQPGKLSPEDMQFKNIFDSAKEYIKDEKELAIYFKNHVQGRGNMLLPQLGNSFQSKTFTKRKIYIELVPLIKLICKDNIILSRDKHFNSKRISDLHDRKSDADYQDYLAKRVKKILYK